MKQSIIAAITSTLFAVPIVHAADISLSGRVSQRGEYVIGIIKRPDDASSWNIMDAGVSGTRFGFTGSDDAEEAVNLYVPGSNLPMASRLRLVKPGVGACPWPFCGPPPPPPSPTLPSESRGLLVVP